MKKITALILAVVTVFFCMSTTVIADQSTDFELPIKGATGFASTTIILKNSKGKELYQIPAGTSFKIYREYENQFLIITDVEGKRIAAFVEKNATLINLPDIIPSIIYEDTNSKESLFVSSGEAINNVTGKKLYDVYCYNPRLEEDEYLMPVLYPMAIKIQRAQNEALKNGDSLKIYETYRPQETQELIYNEVSLLMQSNWKVYNGINTWPWTENWFIAKGKSNHQKCIAMDVSLVKVESFIEKEHDNIKYKRVENYTEYWMPTRIHELSSRSAVFTTGVYTQDENLWKWATTTESFQSSFGAKQLQKYCTSAGLTPLASEWWHFNDLDAEKVTKCEGDFKLGACVSGW